MLLHSHDGHKGELWHSDSMIACENGRQEEKGHKATSLRERAGTARPNRKCVAPALPFGVFIQTQKIERDGKVDRCQSGVSHPGLCMEASRHPCSRDQHKRTTRPHCSESLSTAGRALASPAVPGVMWYRPRYPHCVTTHPVATLYAKVSTVTSVTTQTQVCLLALSPAPLHTMAYCCPVTFTVHGDCPRATAGHSPLSLDQDSECSALVLQGPFIFPKGLGTFLRAESSLRTTQGSASQR